MAQNNLLDNFKLRAEQCVEWASHCGWGFGDVMSDFLKPEFLGLIVICEDKMPVIV